MNKRDLLKQKSKPKLATSVNAAASTALAVKETEIDRLTLEIRSDIEELQDIHEWWQQKKERAAELKQSIVEKLVYIRDNKKALLPDRALHDYLTDDIGISKGYFYEQLQAYDVCVEYNKPDLFNDVDHKVLVNIAREKDKDKQKELINKAPTLSREYFKKVSPTDFSDEIPVSADRENLGFYAPDAKTFKAIEKLLKQNGFDLDYV